MYKILVVDDNRETANGLAKLLKITFDVDTFYDSEKALAAILAGSYACVLSDGEMPFMSGPHLMQETLKQKPSMSKRFVFHTASPFAIMSALRDIGEAEVLDKPATKGELVEAIMKAISA